MRYANVMQNKTARQTISSRLMKVLNASNGGQQQIENMAN
jgi:hypothetical protein